MMYIKFTAQSLILKEHFRTEALVRSQNWRANYFKAATEAMKMKSREREH